MGGEQYDHCCMSAAGRMVCDHVSWPTHDERRNRAGLPEWSSASSWATSRTARAAWTTSPRRRCAATSSCTTATAAWCVRPQGGCEPASAGGFLPLQTTHADLCASGLPPTGNRLYADGAHGLYPRVTRKGTALQDRPSAMQRPEQRLQISSTDHLVC